MKYSRGKKVMQAREIYIEAAYKRLFSVGTLETASI